MGVRAKHVFRWDLDKTYLKTEFDTVKDLVKSFTEAASDKKAYPGAAALLRSLRRTTDHRICILSGSPSQMRTVLTAKLAMDGIEFDEFILKNNLHNLLRLRFRALRSQVPYKLAALLESRSGIIGTASETLFGDDSEADGAIYSLYGDILAGTIDPDDLLRTLQAARAYPDQIKRTMALAEHVRGSGDCVERILIHLDKHSPTDRFSHFGQRLVPIHNYLQAALVMYQDERISCSQVLFVMKEMIASDEYEIDSLANSMQDLLMRGRLQSDCCHHLVEEIRTNARGAATTVEQEQLELIANGFEERASELGSAQALVWPEGNPKLDYVKLIDHEHNRKRSESR